MSEDRQAVVIDNGTGMIKAGIAGDDSPKAYFPSVIGIPKYNRIQGADDQSFFVGQDAINKKGVLTLQYPVSTGIISNWEHMEKIWHYTYYNELKADPMEHSVMLTEAPLNPKKNREKMMEIFFDKFKVPNFYVSIQAVLALYASGKTTGVVVDSGDGVTHCVVVYDGYSISHVTTRNNLAGRNLTEYFQKHIAEEGLDFSNSAEKEIIKDIKEKLCYVAQNFNEEMELFSKDPSKKKEYELPDGKKIKLGDLIIRTPEILFDPTIIGMDIPSLPQLVYNTIQSTEIDLRKDLYENITLSGGTTMFPGLQERLSNELGKLVSQNMKVKVIAPPERKFGVWIGGSVLSSLATFQSSWISQEEYAEIGPSIVKRKCFKIL